MSTVRALLEVLGTAVTPLAGTEGLDNAVSEVVLLGPDDPLPDTPGVVLLCVDPTGLLPRLAGSRCAAVVLKTHATDPRIWQDCALPVIAADESLPWHHLLRLLTTAVSSAGLPAGGGAAIGDLFALANSVAAMVGGAVAIEDPQRRVLAYSSLPNQPIDATREQGILGRQVPMIETNDSTYRDLYRSEGVWRQPRDGDLMPRLAVAVRSGPEVLGSLWVIESTPLGPEAEQALLDAGRLTALHLLRARAGADVERRARAELLRGLLDGRSSPELAASRLGFDVFGPIAVLGFQVPAQVASDAKADAVADLVQLQCTAVRPGSTVLVQLGIVYALIPLAPETSRARLLELAHAVVTRARAALSVELRGAVSATAPSLHGLERSRAEVDAVLRLLVAPGAATVAAVEQVLPQVLLLQLQGLLSNATHLRLPAVEELIRNDQEHGTPYVESVLAYFSSNGDIPAAADRVSVHANTFRYRLRRVRELFGLDLEDPDVRLMTWLQLRTRS